MSARMSGHLRRTGARYCGNVRQWALGRTTGYRMSSAQLTPPTWDRLMSGQQRAGICDASHPLNRGKVLTQIWIYCV